MNSWQRVSLGGQGFGGGTWALGGSKLDFWRFGREGWIFGDLEGKAGSGQKKDLHDGVRAL